MTATMKSIVLLLLFLSSATCLLPPKFEWKSLDFKWNLDDRNSLLALKQFVPENTAPSGLARWKNKLFITIPKWKKGVPASLNYINVDGEKSQPLMPYPSWYDAFVPNNATRLNTNATVVSAFGAHVDRCDRLWVADCGVTNMASPSNLKQVSSPAIVIFDLKTDRLIRRFEIPPSLLKDSSVLNSIVVDLVGDDSLPCHKKDAYAYITDMGSSAIIVYSLRQNEAWRVEHPFFYFDPIAGVYKIGGIRFYWMDGVSSAALSNPKHDGYRDLYVYPTSSTKQFKISTKLLRNKQITDKEIFHGVQIMGDRGPNSQSTACDFDPNSSVLFYTQLNKNGVSCWNTNMPLEKENVPCIVSDCNVLQFPHDLKVDSEGNLWILSNRLSTYLYRTMNFNEVNFRILTAPVAKVIKGSACESPLKSNPSNSIQSLHKQKILQQPSFTDVEQNKVKMRNKQEESQPKPDNKQPSFADDEQNKVKLGKKQEESQSKPDTKQPTFTDDEQNKVKIGKKQEESQPKPVTKQLTFTDDEQNKVKLGKKQEESESKPDTKQPTFTDGEQNKVKIEKKQEELQLKLDNKIPSFAHNEQNKVKIVNSGEESQSKPDNKHKLHTEPEPVEVKTYELRHQPKCTTLNEEISKVVMTSGHNLHTKPPQTSTKMDQLQSITTVMSSHHKTQHIGNEKAIKERVKLTASNLRKWKQKLMSELSSIVIDEPETATSTALITTNEQQTSTSTAKDESQITTTTTTSTQQDLQTTVVTKPPATVEFMPKAHVQLSPIKIIEKKKLKFQQSPEESRKNIVGKHRSNNLYEQSDHQTSPMKGSEQKLDFETAHKNVSKQKVNIGSTQTEISKQNLEPYLPSEISDKILNDHPTPKGLSQRKLDSQHASVRVSEQKLDHQPSEASKQKSEMQFPLNKLNEQQLYHQPTPSKLSEQNSIIKPMLTEISTKKSTAQPTPIRTNEQHFDTQPWPHRASVSISESQRTPGKSQYNLEAKYTLQGSEQKLHCPSTQSTRIKIFERKLDYQPTSKELSKDNIYFQKKPIFRDGQCLEDQLTPNDLSRPKVNSYHAPSRSEPKSEFQSTSNKVTEQLDHQQTVKELCEQKFGYEPEPKEIIDQSFYSQRSSNKLSEHKFDSQPATKILIEQNITTHHRSLKVSEQFDPQSSRNQGDMITDEQKENPNSIPDEVDEQKLEPQHIPRELSEPKINPHYPSKELTEQYQPGRIYERESQPQTLPIAVDDQKMEQSKANGEKENNLQAQLSIKKTKSNKKQLLLNKPSRKSSIFRRLLCKK